MAKSSVYFDKSNTLFFDATSGWVTNGHWAIKRDRFLSTFKLKAEQQSLLDANISFSFTGYNKQMLTGEDCGLPNIEQTVQRNTPYVLQPTGITVDDLDIYEVIDANLPPYVFPFVFVFSCYSNILEEFPVLRIAEPSKNEKLGITCFTGLIKCYNSKEDEESFEAALMPALTGTDQLDAIKNLAERISTWESCKL